MSAAAQIAKPDYTYWMNALAGKFGAVHDGDPQPGFYRKRTGKAAGYVPVAIWEQGGKIVALVDGKESDAAEIWSYVCQYPILEEWYRARMIGQPWPDESAAVTASLAPPPSGHNNPPTDEAEILKGQIEAASAGVSEYAEIKDDETASKAQSLRSRLLELSGEAEKKHKVEKAPSLEEGRRIDKRWFNLRDVAKTAADSIRAALSAHETRKDNERKAIERAAEDARIKAEREATKARAEAHLSGKPAPVQDAPLPVSAPIVPPPTLAVRGSYGRAASVKTVKVVTITDQDAAYVFLKTHKELIELMGKLAQRAVDAGYAVPGTSVEERKDVR